MSKFSFIDLFAGIGGFRLALERVGGHCIGFSEIAPDAIEYYCQNHGDNSSMNFGDICGLSDLPPHDFLTGGVPCQSWSIAGKNLGFDDSRGQLWNDALFLLKKSRPKAFIFENVKGLADPRNRKALSYILQTIKDAGYHADVYLLNAFDYGVPQNRVRIYIIGFRDSRYFERFQLPEKVIAHRTLADPITDMKFTDVFRPSVYRGKQSLSANGQGMNDYFLFNDLRGGLTTVHSWDIIDTTEKEKRICVLLMQNRRKKCYGNLDGNPLSLHHFQQLDESICFSDIEGLVLKGILKAEQYLFEIDKAANVLSEGECNLLSSYTSKPVTIDELKSDRDLRIAKVNVVNLMQKLCNDGVAKCIEIRYDFKNTKISTGINGVNRVFLPTSRVYPTLVASDTNDFVTEVQVSGISNEDYKRNFIEQVYLPGNYRRITKEEACRIQGFPSDFKLPSTRARWMKLIGNSVAVDLIEKLAYRVVKTGVFCESDYDGLKPSVGLRVEQMAFDF